jgi:hypothetical protein
MLLSFSYHILDNFLYCKAVRQHERLLLHSSGIYNFRPVLRRTVHPFCLYLGLALAAYRGLCRGLGL